MPPSDLSYRPRSKCMDCGGTGRITCASLTNQACPFCYETGTELGDALLVTERHAHERTQQQLQVAQQAREAAEQGLAAARAALGQAEGGRSVQQPTSGSHGRVLVGRYMRRMSRSTELMLADLAEAPCVVATVSVVAPACAPPDAIISNPLGVKLNIGRIAFHRGSLVVGAVLNDPWQIMRAVIALADPVGLAVDDQVLGHIAKDVVTISESIEQAMSIDGWLGMALHCSKIEPGGVIEVTMASLVWHVDWLLMADFRKLDALLQRPKGE